jgi:hypothetical protein
MVSAASNPPLHKTQGRGTNSFGTGGENRKSKAWATRPVVLPASCMGPFGKLRAGSSLGVLGEAEDSAASG